MITTTANGGTGRSLSLCLVLLCLALVSRAGNFPVINGNNAGAGSLRQAILNANAAGPGPHTITFGVTGVITITSSLPAITVSGLTIDGGGTVTISGPAASDNTVVLFVLNTGANNTVIKGLTLQNTGTQPITINGALSGVTLENLWLRQTGADYWNYGIYVGAASTNMTIRNVAITDIQKGTTWGMRFRSTVTGLTIEGMRMYNSGVTNVTAGNDIRGIQFEGTVSNTTIRNSTFDLDAPGSADDGNYGIYFNTTVNGFTLDSVQMHDAEVYHVYFAGAASNINLNLCEFDNFDGWTNNQAVRFNSNVNIVNIDSCVFNADLNGTTDDGNNSLYFNGNMQRVTVTKSTFTEADADGIYAITGLNNDFITITGNTFLRIGTGGAHAGVHLTTTRNTTSDGGPVLISDNTFRDLNGVGIYVRPNNTTTYIIPNLTIRNNVITGCKVYGGIKVNYIDKIVITQNSIYNNVGIGIDLTDNSAANCAYEGANTPQLLSSGETSPGVYTISVRMPAICGTNGCSLELFSNEAGVKGIGGQHYVQTFTGLGQGIRTLTNVTGAFPEITAAPFGTWTATLRAAVNCGTSEFSNKIPIKVNGPAGVDLGIKLWLRGDDISVNGSEPTADGQVITGWEEFSGGGAPNAYTIVNNPVVRLGRINFNPVADMDNDLIRGVFPGGPTWSSTPTTTTVAVFNPLSVSASGDRFFVLFAQGSTADYNNPRGQIEFYRNNNNIHSYRNSVLLAPPIPGTTGISAFDKPGVFTSVTTGTSHAAYYNAGNMGTSTYANKGNFALSQWFIGGGYGPVSGGGSTWQWMSETDFAEVFTYNRTLTAPELQRVQSYMALKYGIAMKQSYVLSNGTQVWDIAANAAHSKEIAALVRDNLSILHQKQAKAFQTDEVVSIGLGAALAATNKDNDGAISNDLSVLMWGNDSASTAFTQSFTAGTYSTTRMPRVWKVQKQNWSDQEITIQLKNGEENNYLLISTDPAFGSITQELKLSRQGAIAISSSLLANGVYFSFGREQKQPGGVLNGLATWVKADMGVNLSGTNAITWEDQGPSQRVWPKINTLPLTWNSAAMNYNPAIMFPGPGTPANYFNLPTFTTSFTQGEVFSVQSSAVNNVAGFPFHLGGTSGTVQTFYRFTDNNMYLYFGTNARRNFAYTGKNLALPAILNVSSAANSWTASLDGKIYGGPAAYATSFTQMGTNSAIGVGYSSYFNGPISEVILYNRKLNDTERRQVNSYMALKYGITLDQTTPSNYLASDGTSTMWNATDNAGFNFNIAGLGRDENGTLYQKQSRSINTAASGNLIAVAVGNELAVSNDANTDTITNDKSFLVWADNNGAITYTSNATGAHVTLRMPRVWKVDKTNWADRNITIKLYGSARNTYLLINNSDGTFATIDQELPVNADSTITINSSLLPDGAYFTFGKQILGPGFVNSNIVTWQRADDGVSAADAWYDFSGNGNDATQAVVAEQPVVLSGASDTAMNFNPGFLFKPSVEWFDYNNNLTLSGTGNKTVLWVAKSLAATGNPQSVLSHNSTGSNLFVSFVDNTYKPQVGVGGGGSTCNPISSPGIAFGNPMMATFNRTSATSATMYTNGGFPATSTCASNFVGQNMRIGARSSTLYYPWNGNIAEVIVYNRSLAAFELQRVHSYLALKYGLTLSQATPTDYVATDWDGNTGTKIWTASKNTGYGFRIAGIGRDDLTKLYQKQSRSAEANSMITVATGTAIAADNASNGGSIDDLSFLSWSDNNLSTAFGTTVTGVANATHRMARVWKVDRTNWTDQDITIGAEKIGVRYLLVHDTDPNFGAGTKEYAINTTTSSVTISSAELPDGAFFTLATKIVGPGCVNNNVRAWLKADYAYNGSSWIDFSGQQQTFTQPTAASQPAFKNAGLNFNASLGFDGGDWFNIPALYTATDSITAFFISRTNSLDGVNWMNMAEFGDDQPGFYWRGGRPTLWVDNVTTTNMPHTKTYNTTTHALFGFVIPNGNPKDFRIIADGASESFAGADGTFTVNGANAGRRLGGVVTDASQVNFNGEMAEVVFYKGVLTAAEMARVQSYLALKYGITLNNGADDYIASDGTTRMWTAADNTGYNFRITGIGRDNCDELHQKQSRSQNGGLVTIAIGGVVAPTNEENTDSIVNNNSYFVIADNNMDTTWSVPLTISGVKPTVRMPRVWKVDKTNWADGDLTLKYNRSVRNIYLLISDDPTFATNVQEMALNATDSTISLGSDLLPDGAYFTFAREVYGPGFVNQGIQVWLRADDGVSAVDNWQDYSGNENHALQATAANQPVAVTAAVNFNPGFDFDGAADYMDIASGLGISGTNPFTVMGAGMRQAAGTWDVYVAQPDGQTNDYFFGYHTSNVAGTGATGTAASLATTVIGANVPNFIGLTRSGNNFNFFANGKADGSVSAALTFNTDNTRIGNRAVTADLAFDGYMNEVFVYNRALTTTELLKVQSYLALKYGITLDNGNSNYVGTDWDGSAGTVYWNTDGVYKNNIAGIGRDDKTSLLQKQSRSVNTAANGNMMAIGLESIAATNVANTASFTDDLSFMVWGDNGLTGNMATEYPSELDPNGCSKVTRLQREWKVQETGTVGFVQIQFSLAGLVPNSATISDFSLLIDDDGDFAGGVTTIVTPASYDAATQTLSFDNVDFSNTQYFTLVTDVTNEAPGGITTNLYTWYRADKGVSTATGVSQWLDQSASGLNVVQATAGAQPIYNTTTNLMNFNPTLGFDGTNDVLSNAAWPFNAGVNGEDIFTVILPTSGDYMGFGRATAGTENFSRFYMNGPSVGYLSRVGASNPFIESPILTANSVQIANPHRDAAGNTTLDLNGTTAVSGSVNVFPSINYLNIGARRSNTPTTVTNDLWYTGQIAEVVVYNRQLSTADREKVASYLAIKYGITMQHNYVYPDGTVVWDQAANAGYGWAITGIGRDDCNGMHQKQSRSTNAMAMLTIASGSTVEASNAANLNVLENNTALLFGDNHGAIDAWTATESPSGRNRVAREWKLQMTGTVGTVTIQVPASTSAATFKLPSELNKMYMLVDDDGDFSSGASEVEMTLNGTNWEVSYEFSGNTYFTFATGTDFLTLTTKAILQGAWNGTAMRTDLKAAGVLPATDPYGLNATPSADPNAAAAPVVDWIKVELRDVANPATVVASRAAFVLADGTITDMDYTSPLAFFGVDRGNYIVAVRHRNHLGAMTLAAIDFSTGTATVDFTNGATANYGNNAQKDLGSGVMGLWAGSVNGDSSVRHSAKPSDVSAVVNAVLTHSGNAASDPAYTGFINAYSPFDVNLDGRVYYTASPSDRAIITNNVVTHPANTFGLTSYIILEQIP